MNANASIHVAYALRREAFKLDVDVQLPTRGITGLFGASGAGKTTLLRCIAGLEPAPGKLVVGGEVWQDSDAGITLPAQQRNIGYVFQEPRLFDHLSVAANIDYGRKRRGGQADTQHIVELLGLEDLLMRRPRELSGGEAQRVAIARALSCSPRFMLMDEPLASLDQARKDDILPFLDRLHAESEVPIIYVSHNVEEVCRLCDHLVVMAGGVVEANGALQQVLVDLDGPMAAGDQAGAIIEATIDSHDEGDGLTRVEFSGGSLWVAGATGSAGDTLRLRIRAADVSLCRVLPEQTTILNILPAVVESVDNRGAVSATVRLLVGGDCLLARITRRSLRELDIKPGDQLHAQVKSVAVRPPL